MEILTLRLKIREFHADDFEAVYELVSDPQVRRFEGAPLSEAEVRYRLEGALEWAREIPRAYYKMAIIIPPDDRAVGRVSLKAVDPAARSCDFGLPLHPRIWGIGYASEASKALLQFAFMTLNAHRVTASGNAENIAQ